MRYKQDGTTKECLEFFPGCTQLYCARDRGIYRKNKHDNRVHKRIQHEKNLQARAVKNQGRK